MPGFLDHRLLPAKVGSPALQSTNEGKEKMGDKRKKKKEKRNRPLSPKAVEKQKKRMKGKVQSQGGPGPPSSPSPSLSTSPPLSPSLLLRAWVTILPTRVSRRKVKTAGAARTIYAWSAGVLLGLVVILLGQNSVTAVTRSPICI